MAKYEEIEVELTGTDGNAFSIMGAVSLALKRGGVSREERDRYFEEATAGDYEHLLITTLNWVRVS